MSTLSTFGLYCKCIYIAFFSEIYECSKIERLYRRVDTCANEEDQAGVDILRNKNCSRLHSNEPNMHSPIYNPSTIIPEHRHNPSISFNHTLWILQQEPVFFLISLRFFPLSSPVFLFFSIKPYCHSDLITEHKKQQQKDISISHCVSFLNELAS